MMKVAPVDKYHQVRVIPHVIDVGGDTGVFVPPNFKPKFVGDILLKMGKGIHVRSRCHEHIV
jgi:hypothetical protein